MKCVFTAVLEHCTNTHVEYYFPKLLGTRGISGPGEGNPRTSMKFRFAFAIPEMAEGNFIYYFKLSLVT